MRFVVFILVSMMLYTLQSYSADLKWNLNDVSYLYNLPKPGVIPDYFLRPMDHGDYGNVIPKSIYDKLHSLTLFGSDNETIYNNTLRAVSFRVDPCTTIENGQCAPEIRIIWQPSHFNSLKNIWEFEDGAVHSFYSVTNLQMRSFLDQLWKLKVENYKKGIVTDGIPLNVHPAFKTQWAEQFGVALKTLILKNCGEQNLFKITFMSTIQPTNWWRFGGFEKSGAEWFPISIPRYGVSTVDIFNDAKEENLSTSDLGQKMDSIMAAQPTNYPVEDDIRPIINEAFRKNSDEDKPIFSLKMHALDRFRNPHRTNPKNLDCASCHYADGARFYSTRAFPELNGQSSEFTYLNPDPNIYNSFNGTVTEKGTRVLRAFGYFSSLPAVNQRTINESIEISHWLNVKSIIK